MREEGGEEVAYFERHLDIYSFLSPGSFALFHGPPTPRPLDDVTWQHENCWDVAANL